MSSSSAFRRAFNSGFVYIGKRKKGFFYTDDEGRVRFAGGPSSGSGGSSENPSGLPPANATGKTKRTIEKKVYIIEDVINKALTEAALVPIDKLPKKRAERTLRAEALNVLRQQEHDRLQAVNKRMYSEGMTEELMELAKPRIPTDADVAPISTNDITKRAYQLEVALRLPGNSDRTFEKLDFSSAQSLVATYNDYLDRRIQGQHSNYSRSHR